MNRLTIKDIAKEAGVSTAAVSFALNKRPGVSPATRQKILETAERIGWAPNSRAQSLSLAKADAVGLFIARQPDSFDSERFFFNFIVGVQSTLTASNYDLVFHTGPDLDAELATYRKWWAQGRVDGVVVVDPRAGDPRLTVLKELSIPAVVVGAQVPDTACIATDEGGLVRALAQHLLERGARTIGYVPGLSSLIHTQERIAALREFGEQHGVHVEISKGTNATEEAGYEAVQKFLAAPAELPIDGLLFDNEILALGGMSALRSAGVKVGREVLVCSCEDSPVCRVVKPAITAAHREPSDLGEHAARLLLEVLGGHAPHTVLEQNVPIIARGSTKGIRAAGARAR
ncbi:MAG: LacI family transcriptional regulator [Arcanobacterium sp.]|nr:LacI family transcriptional regulator [Arcanobacterium sp.]